VPDRDQVAVVVIEEQMRDGEELLIKENPMQ
jgi:hypothetical protein